MADDVLLHRARQLWTELAVSPVPFPGAAFEVVVSPRSTLCPPGWVGIVALGRSAIVTAPADATADLLRSALAGLPAAALTDPAVLLPRLPVTELLGPATLAYCDANGFRTPASSRPDDHFEDPAAASALDPGDDALTAFLARVPSEDVAESGMDDITSPAFVTRTGSEIVAVAGYRMWPAQTAHISVLTAPGARGRGLARLVAGAAVAAALAADLLPQWRARPEASRRVARSLGFRELGTQLSIRISG
jgi:hypothetical protein